MHILELLATGGRHSKIAMQKPLRRDPSETALMAGEAAELVSRDRSLEKAAGWSGLNSIARCLIEDPARHTETKDLSHYVEFIQKRLQDVYGVDE